MRSYIMSLTRYKIRLLIFLQTFFMQVWQLFHILQDYCNITTENPYLYCNMIKHLLQKQKIHGHQSIHSLTCISSTNWQDFFRDSIFTPYHAQKLQTTLINIDEYLRTHGITSILNASHTDNILASISRSTCFSSPKESTSVATQNTVYHVAIGLITGFSMGWLYAWYMNK